MKLAVIILAILLALALVLIVCLVRYCIRVTALLEKSHDLNKRVMAGVIPTDNEQQ